MQLLPLKEDLANAKKAAAAAQAPTTDVDGASAAAGVSDASADTNAVSAAQLASARGKPRSGERQGRQPYGHGPELGQHRGLNAKVGATVTGGMIMGESDTSGGKQCMQIADLSR